MQQKVITNLEQTIPDNGALGSRFNWFTQLSLAITLFTIACFQPKAYAGNWDVDANGTPVLADLLDSAYYGPYLRIPGKTKVASPWRRVC